MHDNNIFNTHSLQLGYSKMLYTYIINIVYLNIKSLTNGQWILKGNSNY